MILLVSLYHESVRNDQIFYRSISCVHNITHKFRLSIYRHPFLVSMNENKTVEVNGLLALHSRKAHVIHLVWISGEVIFNDSSQALTY